MGQISLDGYLFAKLHAIGSKSEGPTYQLQLWDGREIVVQKRVQGWKEEPALHKRLGTKVTISGERTDDGITFDDVAEYRPPRAP